MLREITHPALRVVRHASTSEARELLAAAVERDLLELQTVGRIVDLMPLGDLRAELTLLSRWVLGGIDRQRELILVFEKEGDSLPDLRDRFYEAGDLSYRVAVDYVRRLSKANPRMEGVDPEALAAVTMNALVNHRRCLWTFKRNPLDLDDERMVSGGVDVLMHLAGPTRNLLEYEVARADRRGIVPGRVDTILAEMRAADDVRASPELRHV